MVRLPLAVLLLVWPGWWLGDVLVAGGCGPDVPVAVALQDPVGFVFESVVPAALCRQEDYAAFVRGVSAGRLHQPGQFLLPAGEVPGRGRKLVRHRPPLRRRRRRPGRRRGTQTRLPTRPTRPPTGPDPRRHHDAEALPIKPPVSSSARNCPVPPRRMTAPSTRPSGRSRLFTSDWNL